MSGTVLEVRDLGVALPAGADRAHAVRNITFSVASGEIVCLLGESGSGKSIIAQTVMGLLPSNVRATEGAVLLLGEDVLRYTAEQLRAVRGVRMSMIFQEPMTALNPVMTCGEQVDEMLTQHTPLPAVERRRKIRRHLCAGETAGARAASTRAIRISSPAASASGS